MPAGMSSKASWKSALPPPPPPTRHSHCCCACQQRRSFGAMNVDYHQAQPITLTTATTPAPPPPPPPPHIPTTTYVWGKEFVLGIVMSFAKDEDRDVLLDAFLPVWRDAVTLRANTAGIDLVDTEHAVANFARETFGAIRHDVTRSCVASLHESHTSRASLAYQHGWGQW